jgi:ferredoxin
MGSYTDFEAVEDASRCFSCGPCYICPTCLPNCDNKQLVAEIDNSTVLIKAPIKFSSEISEIGPKSFKIKSDGSEKSMKLYSLLSKIDSDLCIGCGRCEELCAYRAISSVVLKEQRTVSQVAQDSCAACSACISECPSGAISQGYMSDKEVLSRLDKKNTPYDGVKGLMSFWSTNSPYFDSYEGITDIMSERKPSPMFLIRALTHAGRGLLIIRPDKEKGSHYLPWEESPENVLKYTWKLLKSVGISHERIKYVHLQEGENPINLIKEFSKELDKKDLKKSIVTFPAINGSPFGEAITYLRILGAYPDIKPDEDLNKLPICKSNGDAYFEGCLPMLHLIGEAHNLYDISPTRLSIFELFNILNMNLCSIPGFSCPSKGLLQYKLDSIVSKIEESNLKAYIKANPRKMIIATPEAFASFSKDKKFGKVTSLVDELIYSIKNNEELKRVARTVAIHKACKMDKDPYYDSTKRLIKMIPGIKIVELNGNCGHSNFDKIDGKSKQDAENLMKEVVQKGADTIICTSPYCESHLLMCSREGSWRSTDIEISDVYQTLLLSIKGDL